MIACGQLSGCFSVREAVVVEILSAVLTGANITSQNHNWVSEPAFRNDFGQMMIAISVDAFMSLNNFEERMTHLQQSLRSVSGTVILPGEPETAAERVQQENGILLETDILEKMRTAAMDWDMLALYEEITS
jgi:LDH2 family malate/lactate/ureidoglycolate dehydrogenase